MTTATAFLSGQMPGKAPAFAACREDKAGAIPTGGDAGRRRVRVEGGEHVCAALVHRSHRREQDDEHKGSEDVPHDRGGVPERQEARGQEVDQRVQQQDDCRACSPLLRVGCMRPATPSAVTGDPLTGRTLASLGLACGQSRLFSAGHSFRGSHTGVLFYGHKRLHPISEGTHPHDSLTAHRVHRTQQARAGFTHACTGAHQPAEA